VLQKDFTKGVRFSDRHKYHKIELLEDGDYASVNVDGSKLVVDGILDPERTYSGMSPHAQGIMHKLGQAIRYKYREI